MAKIDDLVKQIADKGLRQKLENALADIKRRQRFGLVFEEHIPETSALMNFPITVGSTVQRRNDREANVVYHVAANGRGRKVKIEPENGGDVETVNSKDLMVVKRFGEPIFPALTSVGSTIGGPKERPQHSVINGENFHALQLLVYLYESQVDCIYIDPPYNTGARDWKYNNRYVDKNDVWRHSKWLSFMEKRLRLARRLLKSDSVLIVAIDENEIHHLGMLLEKLFPESLRQMVTICVNPSGASGDGLSRVDEYAFFCYFGEARPNKTADDRLTANKEKVFRWESLLRGGNAWYRTKRENLCYPILIDPKTKRIVGTGEPLKGDDESKRRKRIKGKPVAWPVRLDGKLGIWRVEGDTLMSLVKSGYAYLSSRNDARDTWTIKYLMKGTIDAINDGLMTVVGKGAHGEVKLETSLTKKTLPKTMWYRGRHTAGGSGGTHALVDFLGERDLFPFPKSFYTVHDCLEVAVGHKDDALILDFFAGSGTTFHSTCLLNAQDNGSRRCVLVTNNEVNEQDAKDLMEKGYFRGHPKFESQGIFERVTRPRCDAVVTGHRPDGEEVEGEYADGRPYSEGFSENVQYFQIDYLDADDVDLGNQFESILPSLWLAAGAKGDWRDAPETKDFLLPKSSSYAVLFRESAFRKLRKALEKRTDVTHVWIITDSEEAFAEMRSDLPREIRCSMLYRDYLRNFRINTGQNL